MGTEPATGTPVDAGDTVTVLLSHQVPNTDCIGGRMDPWEVLDFVTGRGPAPAMAPHVAAFVNGRATDSTAPVLKVLRESVEEVVGVDGELLPPSMQASGGDAAGRGVRDT